MTNKVHIAPTLDSKSRKQDSFFIGSQTEQPTASPRISRSLTKAIAEKGGEELTLWGTLPDEEKELWVKSSSYEVEDSSKAFALMIRDRRGKPVSLNYMEYSVVRYIENYITTRRYEEEIAHYIGNVSTGKTLKEIFKGSPQIELDTRDITKAICGRTGKAQLERVSEAVISLSEKWQSIEHTFPDGAKQRYSTRFIAMQAKGEYVFPSEVMSKAGRKATGANPVKEKAILIKAYCCISPLFYNLIGNDFSPVKPNLFDVLQNNRSEIFRVLLSYLETHYRQTLIAVSKAGNIAKYSKDNKGLSPEELNKRIAEAKNKARAIEPPILYSTLNNKLEKQYSKRKKYDFLEDLKKAVNALINDYKIITGADFMEDRVRFWINLDFATFEERETLLSIGEDSRSLEDNTEE